MINYYLHLFEYNDWSNNKILKTITENKITNQKIFSLFSHIIIAQILWLNRINKETYEFKDFWQMLNPGEMNMLSREFENNLDSLVNLWYVENSGSDETGIRCFVLVPLLSHCG